MEILKNQNFLGKKAVTGKKITALLPIPFLPTSSPPSSLSAFHLFPQNQRISKNIMNLKNLKDLESLENIKDLNDLKYLKKVQYSKKMVKKNPLIQKNSRFYFT